MRNILAGEFEPDDIDPDDPRPDQKRTMIADKELDDLIDRLITVYMERKKAQKS